MGGAAVRPDVCPQPTAGATVRLVCAFSSPLLGAGGIHCGVAWPVWATCTLPGLLCWGSGVLAGADRPGAQGWEEQAQLTFPSEIRFGGALRHQAGVRPAGGTDLQKHSVGCLCGASKFPGRNWFPLGFLLGDGRGRWRWRAPLFPAKLSSVVRGSTTLPPVVLQPSRSPSRAVSLHPSRCQVPLAVRTHSVWPFRFCQPDSGGSAWPEGRPSAPAPSRQSVERTPPLRPSYRLPWASSLCLAPETPFC